MRRETVAEGIRRRQAEQARDTRRRMRLAVWIAVWSSGAGVLMIAAGLAASTLGAHP